KSSRASTHLAPFATSSPISRSIYISLRERSRSALAGGSRSPSWAGRGFRRCTARLSSWPSATISALLPDAFFAGPGLDRADHLRFDEEELKRIAQSPAARELVWSEGLPSIDQDGRLQLQPVQDPKLFLGLTTDAPIYSPLQDEFADAWKAFGLLAILDPADSPTFAAALSLARWHARHLFCANCGHLSDIVRGGWSRRCPACAAEHFPRVDPVVIMIAEHEGRLLLGRQPHYPPNRYSALA